MLIETFIRRHLALKAHTVTAVEQTDTTLVIRIDQLGSRRLRCGHCGRAAKAIHDVRPERQWQGLTMRGVAMVLRYSPRRVSCPHGGVHVEAYRWAEPWARVTCAPTWCVITSRS